jgi:hypothetical protein
MINRGSENGYAVFEAGNDPRGGDIAGHPGDKEMPDALIK